MVDYIHLYFSVKVSITVQVVVFIQFLFDIIDIKNQSSIISYAITN